MMPIRHKQFYISLLLQISIPVLTMSQAPRVPVGIWYAKFTAYEFKQAGTSTIFTKYPVKNYRQRLIVLDNSTYTYEELAGKDTFITQGVLLIIGDTLIFKPKSSKNYKFTGNHDVKYYLFSSDSSHLIYSYQPLASGKSEEADNRFEPVEVSASYKEGQHEFLKALYKSLETQQPVNNDTSYLNSYSLIISENGELDITTLKAISARPEYLNLVKNALMNLKTNFIPTKQNGRFVKGRMTFKITY